MIEIVLATWNQRKVNWLKAGLSGLSLPIRPLLSNEAPTSVAETGNTCLENAFLKARAVDSSIYKIILAEDSGLCIDALEGFPGTHTARWAPGSDDDRSLYLLEKMKHIPKSQRTARFISAVVIVFPDGREFTCEGRMEGVISFNLVGKSGLGYQRIFQLAGGKTMAQIGPEIVTRVDHRSQSLKQAKSAIQKFQNVYSDSF
ncbi:hypothetical protein JYT44_01155 [Caldithrix abyssi]|nr:hypothetical protein [Caldithrix abyssi]